MAAILAFPKKVRFKRKLQIIFARVVKYDTVEHFADFPYRFIRFVTKKS